MKFFLNTFSRVFGFLLAILVFVLLINLSFLLLDNSKTSSYFKFLEGDRSSLNKIAILNINGPILSEPINFYNFNSIGNINIIYPSLIKEYLADLDKNEIIGLIVKINSPGGSVSASYNVYRLFENFKKNKKIPIYFFSNDLLASGAYWVALAGNKIFTSYGTLVGSIGVKGPDWLYYNSPKNLSTGILGSSVESKNEIILFSNTAGNSKDILNPFRNPTKKELKQLQKTVDNVYEDFVKNVSANRKIEQNVIIDEIGAMIYDSKEAKKLYLIDGIKNLDEIKFLMSQDLKVDKWQILQNKEKESFNLLNIFSFLTKFDSERNGYNQYIKNKFCNNIKNELSVAIIKYNLTC